MTEPDSQIQSEQPELVFVSRGGLKLQQALDDFELSPTNMLCADFGCSTGGFTDCLLQNGARRVHSIDTAYGEFAWKLRTDDRVVIHERSNALHLDPPETVIESGGIDLAVIDLGWTKQNRALHAASRWLKPGGEIISLVKPHYEAQKSDLGDGGLLDPDRAQEIAEETRDSLCSLGYRVQGWTKSPVLGGAVGKKRKKKGRGNPEWIVLVTSEYSIENPPPEKIEH
ncbi:MAG: SAM-dependent methyltransferase [Phycisphaerales bacterium]|nr:SAM-dependent methyltransferase [Phycisphaerales bacterium]